MKVLSGWRGLSGCRWSQWRYTPRGLHFPCAALIFSQLLFQYVPLIKPESLTPSPCVCVCVLWRSCLLTLQTPQSRKLSPFETLTCFHLLPFWTQPTQTEPVEPPHQHLSPFSLSLLTRCHTQEVISHTVAQKWHQGSTWIKDMVTAHRTPCYWL